ncbi:MAG: hypothetical protein Q7V57_06560 [Actinomycetota bacterium]|nr:hypothetical protein [Actinomycetota bacterium]
MTIRRGEAWGETVPSPADLVIAHSDAEARALVVHQMIASDGPLVLGLAAGDLARTMGGGTPGRFPGEVVRAPVDVLRLDAAGQRTWAVAHVVARRQWWRGEVLLAMNAQFLGAYDVAPRAHPNDGRVDVLRVAQTMTLRTRLAARARARIGVHLPHPQITSRQTPGTTVQFARPLTLWVDGERWIEAAELTITVEPDALVVHA